MPWTTGDFLFILFRNYARLTCISISTRNTFSLVNNHRIRDGQLCLSNPAVMSLLTENLRKEMEKKPECNYWSVSQNDCINYCECEHCQALYDKYGNISGAYVDMVNRIAATVSG